MNHKEYIKNALRTESVVVPFEVDNRKIIALLNCTIFSSKLLDLYKKKYFYKKEIDEELFQQYADQLVSAADQAAFTEPYNLEMEELVNVDTRAFHGLIGILTEAGEVAEEFKKGILQGEFDVPNMAAEFIGDISWYTAVLCDVFNLDWEENMKKNIEKLKVRYPNKFTTERAIERDLDKEYETLK